MLSLLLDLSAAMKTRSMCFCISVFSFEDIFLAVVLYVNLRS